MSKKLRVLAVTPTYGGLLRPEMRESMEALDRTGISLEWAVLDDQPYPAPDHRNVLHMYRQAQQRALAEGFDVLWTVEHDMVLPTSAAQNLRKTPGAVVYGVYLLRWGTFVLNTFEYVGDRNIGESLSLHPQRLQAALKQKRVVRVSGCGWGCTWIKRPVLEAIELPEQWPENPAYDVAFAQRVLRANFLMFANFDVICGHMKDGEMMLPFVDNPEIGYSGHGIMQMGQLMPSYAIVAHRGSQPQQAVRYGVQVRVKARQTFVTFINGQSQRLVAGDIYAVDRRDAVELGRAGYVEEAS